MIVQKTLSINLIEPGRLNFRVPIGMETKLDINFLDRTGNIYTSDLAAQLQLTARTTDRSEYYPMPATDVVNGKARAIIPADSLTDPNGYRLRITGSLQGEGALLALGTVLPVAAAGPQGLPVDTIDSIDLAFERGEDVNLNVKLWDDNAKTDPFDLSSSSTVVTANIYEAKGGIILVPFTTTIVSANEVLLSLTVEQVNILPDSCWWSLAALSGGGLTTLCEGTVSVTGTATPPLLETIVAYDYQKPVSSINPVGGQIIHSTIEQNLLKVAKSTEGLQDISATLALVRQGDQILIGVTQWNVVQSVEQAGWYEFMVSPVQLAAVEGSTLVTFSRP